MEHKKICLVTGATDGIGRRTALDLARKDTKVIIIGRNRKKCALVVSNIIRESQNVDVEFEVADLSALSEIHSLAERLNERLARIDVLINNVGAWFHRRTLSVDGIEMTFALNHLSYFLLSGLLLENLLNKAKAARIVNVSSVAHRGPQLNLNDLQAEKRYSGWRAYQTSKLANIFFTNLLAEKLSGTNITVNSLHPGFVSSKFGHNNGKFLKFILLAGQKCFGISQESGAATSVYLALSSEVDGQSGGYFYKCRRSTVAKTANDKVIRDGLWKCSEELTGFKYPNII